MSRESAQTLLVLIGIAVAVAAVVAGLVYAGGSRRAKRYRPGRPFAFTPVWFLASPERPAAPARACTPARPALPAAPAGPPAAVAETGGASDRW